MNIFLWIPSRDITNYFAGILAIETPFVGVDEIVVKGANLPV